LELTANRATTWSANFDLASYAPQVTILAITVTAHDSEDAFNRVELEYIRGDGRAFIDVMRMLPNALGDPVGYYNKPIYVRTDRERFQVRIGTAPSGNARALRVQITIAW